MTTITCKLHTTDQHVLRWTVETHADGRIERGAGTWSGESDGETDYVDFTAGDETITIDGDLWRDIEGDGLLDDVFRGIQAGDVTDADDIAAIRDAGGASGAADKEYTVMISLKVQDRLALRLAAEAKAVEDGIDLGDWRETRADHFDPVTADLIMLLDPGSVTGCSINDSAAERDSSY